MYLFLRASTELQQLKNNKAVEIDPAGRMLDKVIVILVGSVCQRVYVFLGLGPRKEGQKEEVMR